MDGMTLRTYEIIKLVEMTIPHRVRAADARAANNEATKRIARTCESIVRVRPTLAFGDVVTDYVPAVDPSP